jgi:hypothetical protein
MRSSVKPADTIETASNERTRDNRSRRRQCPGFPLPPPPERVIEPREDAANIGAARSLQASSATDGQKAAVPLGAIDVSPIGRERRPPLDQSRPSPPASTAPATIRRRAT